MKRASSLPISFPEPSPCHLLSPSPTPDSSNQGTQELWIPAHAELLNFSAMLAKIPVFLLETQIKKEHLSKALWNFQFLSISRERLHGLEMSENISPLFWSVFVFDSSKKAFLSFFPFLGTGLCFILHRLVFSHCDECTCVWISALMLRG